MSAFLIPVIIMTIAGAFIGIMPFSNGGFLVSDINNQFAAFYTYFKSTISSGGTLTYSLSKTLGGSMYGFVGYYLINPFLFILFLFPNEIISVGIFYMLAIMSGFMSLTFYIMLCESYDDNKSHLIFSTGYALSGYFIAYMTVPGFFCSLILLPLVITGYKRMMITSKRFVLYSLSLAGAVICNYYIGYMICIFCGLYFVFDSLAGKSFTLKRLGSFIASSLFSIVLALPVLIPTVSSLAGQKTSDFKVVLDRTSCYQLKHLIRNLLPGQFYCDYSNGAAPYIYIGLSALLLLVVYFIFGKITLRERLFNLIFLAGMILSTYYRGLDCIWHGFNAPVGFAHRQSFLIVFLCLLLAARGLNSLSSSDNAKFTRLIPVASMILLVLQIGEISYNTIDSMKEYNAREMHSAQEYRDYYLLNSSIIDTIKEGDDGLYRIEKDYDYNHNDAMLFSYAGLSHNSSCESDNIKQFMGRMGFRNQGIWDMYNQGSTVLADSLLGVRYFISRFDSTGKPYDYSFDKGGNYVFKNPYALPFAYIEDADKALNVDMTEPDLFELQNNIAGYDIYTKASYTFKTCGLELNTQPVTDEVTAEAADDYVVGIKNNGSGTLSRTPESMSVYNCSEGEEHYIDYCVTISSDCNLYCYFSAPSLQGCELFVNGASRDTYFSDYRWNIINCGNFLPGDEVSIRLKVTGDSLRLYDAYIYEEHIDTIKKWYDDIISNPVTLSKIKDSYLKGSVTVSGESDDDKLVIFSIPYESGLKLYIDGEPSDSFPVYGCLCAAHIGNGEHLIEIRY